MGLEHWIYALPLRLRSLFRRRQVERELSEEMQYHLEQKTEEYQAQGMTPQQAHQAALRSMDGLAQRMEECRDARGVNFIDNTVRDLRYSLRVLAKSPSFVFVAVLTLALAIAANAVAFGIMNGLVLRPLNLPRAESLLGTVYGDGSGWQSYPNYRDLRDRNRSFEDLATFSFAFVRLASGRDADGATGFATSGNYFDVLGIRPHLGRLYHRSDERGPGSAPYVVLSHKFWNARFAGDRGVVGRTVRVNQKPFTVIGVAPQTFGGTLRFVEPDFYFPIVNANVDLEDRGTSNAIFEVVGHLKPGVTAAQAVADVNSVGAELRRMYPKEAGHKATTLAPPGLTSFGGAAKAFAGGLMLLAGLILLAACANLGGLFAARASDRSREVALRLALGASRVRIVRQLLTEAVLISLAGGAAGLACSVALLRWLSTWQPFPSTPLRLPVAPDARVYLIALTLALVCGFVFGMMPVRQVLRSDPYLVVKAGPAGRTGRRLTLRDALVAVQIAICAVLVTSSLVAVRGLVRALECNLGFETRHCLLANVNLEAAGYRLEQAPALQKRILQAIEAIPGVERVGMVNNYPPLAYAAGARVSVFREDTTDLRPSNALAMPYRYDVSPGYLAAAGTSLLAGRDLNWHDDAGAPRVALVNKTFAALLFGSVPAALGRHFKAPDGKRVQVVGVVEDGKYMSLSESAQPAMFGPALQAPTLGSYLVVRSRGDPSQLAAAMRAKLREVDEVLSADTETWHKLLELVLFPARVATVALGALGGIGVLLSVTGVFGLAAYSVSRRLRELGIRTALGAQRRQLLSSVLGRALRLLVFGSAAGLVLGMLATRVLAAIVYQATPRDPAVLTGVILVMALIGVLATWIPAQRALSADPLKLLREE